MFYFSVRYRISIAAGQEIIFRNWNILDPVDENELLRNDIIQKHQGNRNPFIDNELLVEEIQHFHF